MEFLIISALTISTICYSWYAGYKLGERKGRNNGIAEMENVIKQYWYYHNTGDEPCKKDSTE